MLSVLKKRDYRLLWIGQTVSLVGDQFHLIALPWLVLQLTGDPVTLGLVLGVAGLSRGAFMLPGGAFADRHSPRTIMLGVNVFRLLWTGALAWSVLGGWIEMWMVYLSALVLGGATGLFEPASSAAVPRIVDGDELEGGNALVQMGDWFASFIGPAAAGTLIGLLGTQTIAGEQPASLTGVGLAFAFDTATFAVSILTLGLMAMLPAALHAEKSRPIQDIAEGMRFMWGRSAFRWMLLIVAAANFLMTGPLLVGIPVLAQERLPEGASALGIVLSAYALGNLGGLVAAGSLKNPSGRSIGRLVVGLFALFGVGMSLFAFVERTWIAAPVMVVMGVGNGFLGVTLITTLQRRTPPAMLGRVMSLLMLAMYALVPASQALSGFVINLDFEALYLGVAAGMFTLCAISLSRPEIRRFGDVGMEPAESLLPEITPATA
ncbi:MAG: MFS transporter [Actinobacteria bacterium]|nr:MAG: MFS transporter [Actinomycetota bacterium]